MKTKFRFFNARPIHSARAEGSAAVEAKPLASPPGTLVHVGKRFAETFSADSVIYSAESHTRTRNADPDEAIAQKKESETIWLRLIGLHEVSEVAELEETLSVDPLQLEDILNTNSRPKIEDFDASVFVIARLLEWNEESNSIDSQQISIMLLPDNCVLSFLEAETALFDPVYRRISRKGRRIRRSGGGYLLWAILDAIVDNYLKVTERFEGRLGDLEILLEENPDSVEVAELHAAKRDAVQLVREIRPIRDITNVLSRAETELIDGVHSPFYQDLHDHALQALEAAEGIRESVAALRDFHMTAMSNQMNEVMKVLTCMGAIFLPLTFFAGIYGMNFEHMPELSTKWAYPALWSFFIIVAGLMFWYFRRKRWL